MSWALATAMLATALSPARAPLRVIATVRAPDGRTAIEIQRWPAGEDRYWPVVYHGTRDGKDVVVDSPLGISRAEQDFDAATLTLVGATDVRAIDERYTLRSGRAREHHVVARERTVHFKNPAGAPIDVTLRAQNDGVASESRFDREHRCRRADRISRAGRIDRLDAAAAAGWRFERR